MASSQIVSALLTAILALPASIVQETASRVLEALLTHPATAGVTVQWVHATAIRMYSREMRTMATSFAGWHFSARSAAAEQLQHFDIVKMGERMSEQAPLLWELWSQLLTADLVLEWCQMQHLAAKEKAVKQQSGKAGIRASGVSELTEDEF